MTPVAHSLVGATIGATLINQHPSVCWKWTVIPAMVFCANLPDLPLPYWGHSHYAVSHSVFVGIALVACFSILLRGFPITRTTAGTWSLVIAGSLALLSHYLLDSFYNHGLGISVLWPVSDARLAIPIPWFTTMTTDPLLCWHNVKVWGIELLSFGMVTVVVLAIVRQYQRRWGRAIETSRQQDTEAK